MSININVQKQKCSLQLTVPASTLVVPGERGPLQSVSIESTIRVVSHYPFLQDAVLRERLCRIVLLVSHYPVLQDAVLQDRTASATLSCKNATTAPQARLREREVAIIIIFFIFTTSIIFSGVN